MSTCTHAHTHTQHVPSPFGLPADVTRCAHAELVAAMGNALTPLFSGTASCRNGHKATAGSACTNLTITAAPSQYNYQYLIPINV